VYVHRDRKTSEVFYVGKGYGKRAWQTRGCDRNAAWAARVASLGDEWDVEIVKNDLSEIEAFDLELELVESHGGARALGGDLTNYFPGGEDVASVGIYLDLPPEIATNLAAHDRQRQFIELSRAAQELLAKQVVFEFEAIIDQLNELSANADAKQRASIDDSIYHLDCILGSQVDLAADLLKRRVSWKEFALGLEEVVGDLDLDMLEVRDGKVISLAKQAISAATRLLATVDPGNRAESDEAAEKLAPE